MISILIPLYNGVEFLDDSITSIIAQSFQEWELLIGVNGCSTEEYNAILDKVSQYKNTKINVVLLDVIGKSKTLNELVKIAKYNYVCVLDVDDYWLSSKLEKQLLFIDKYDVVGTNAEYFGSKLGYIEIFLGKLSEKMFSYQNPIINSSVMLKREDAKWDEGWEGLDDYNLWIDLIKQGKTFYNIPEVLVNHRIHEKSFYNHQNGKLNKKLLEEKISPLDENERASLGSIISSQNWEL